jgi:hypothetical protein
MLALSQRSISWVPASPPALERLGRRMREIRDSPAHGNIALQQKRG